MRLNGRNPKIQGVGSKKGSYKTPFFSLNSCGLGCVLLVSILWITWVYRVLG